MERVHAEEEGPYETPSSLCKVEREGGRERERERERERVRECIHIIFSPCEAGIC